MTATDLSYDDQALLRAYPGADVVFDRAFVALPQSDTPGTPETLGAALDHPGPDGRGWPVILFATGSTSFEGAGLVAGWIRDRIPAALVAPNTHLVPGRPRYRSPAAAAVYDSVHALRRMELDYTVARLARHAAFDLSRLTVVGVSEGAVAAATWAPHRNDPRLLIAWSVEDSYFARDFRLPDDPATPILNLMGWRDRFFGATDSLSAESRAGRPTDGHGAARLAAYERARVVLYPSAGHRLLHHPQTRADVVAFLADQMAPRTQTPAPDPGRPFPDHQPDFQPRSPT